jgi:CBS domain-containing protein
MTPNAEGVQIKDRVTVAAQKMEQLNVGALPVFEGNREQGFITDRDLVVRCLAQNLDPETTMVGEVMSKGVVSVLQQQDSAEALALMEHHKIRRVLVRDHTGLITGIVSLGDIAAKSSTVQCAEALKAISAPASPPG